MQCCDADEARHKRLQQRNARRASIIKLKDEDSIEIDVACQSKSSTLDARLRRWNYVMLIMSPRYILYTYILDQLTIELYHYCMTIPKCILSTYKYMHQFVCLVHSMQQIKN